MDIIAAATAHLRRRQDLVLAEINLADHAAVGHCDKMKRWPSRGLNYVFAAVSLWQRVATLLDATRSDAFVYRIEAKVELRCLRQCPFARWQIGE